MPESQTNVVWETLLDLSGEGPLHERLALVLRGLIRSGTLADGAALPPSRALAQDLGCSRWVVTEAYSQLAIEGYLTARTGSATRVRAGVGTSTAATSTPVAAGGRRPRLDLAPGVADLRAFPRTRWVEATRRLLAELPADDLALADPGGHPLLRRGLGDYLRRSRAVEPAGAQVFVTAGAGAGVEWLARKLRAAGHTALAVEEPSWPILPELARQAGLEVIAVPVDDQGLEVSRLHALSGVRAVLLTPAHQFPTGVAMSAQRRAEVIAWAKERDGVVIEDDYDAEFRYDRKPVAALQALAPAHVVLLGSLSKSLAAAVGLGWMVAPPQYAPGVEPGAAPFTPGVLTQLVVAELLASGAYERHVRTQRTRLRRRRDALVLALQTQLPEARLAGLAAGMHLLLDLPGPVSAAEVVQQAAARGLALVPLDRYRGTAAHGADGLPPREALVLGYGNIADARVAEAVRLLAQVVSQVRVRRN